MNLKNIPIVRNLAIRIRHRYWASQTLQNLAAYLKNTSTKKLQLGAGQNLLADWFNTDYFPRKDIFFLDATKKIPVADNSFDYVFSEHHIEHIHYNEAKFMAYEIRRILKPGGIFRVCTPDLTHYLKSYFEPNALNDPFINDILNNWIKNGFYNAKNYIPKPGQENVTFFINDIFLNYDHKFIYDSHTLSELLLDAGFSSVQQLNASVSANENLNGIEAHPPSPYTLVVEATKNNPSF